MMFMFGYIVGGFLEQWPNNESDPQSVHSWHTSCLSGICLDSDWQISIGPWYPRGQKAEADQQARKEYEKAVKDYLKEHHGMNKIIADAHEADLTATTSFLLSRGVLSLGEWCQQQWTLSIALMIRGPWTSQWNMRGVELTPSGRCAGDIYIYIYIYIYI